MSWTLLAVVAAGYLLGSIPFGYLVGKMRGVDVRKSGSGNIGATNVVRVLGKKWGALVFACDAGKGLLAVLLAFSLAPRQAALTPHTLAIIAGISCILGHTYTVWLGFKGGKGVATSAGVLIGLMPLVTLALVLIWVTVFYTSGYVALASLVVALAAPILVGALLFTGWFADWALFYFALALAALIIWRHRSNIQRLLQGTENRFGKAKPSA